MNFTYINGNITFESSQKCLRKYGIIIACIFILNILFLCPLLILRALMDGSFKIYITYLTLFLIIDILDVIIEIKYLINTFKFSKSFNIFNNKLKTLFKRQFGKQILKEYNSLYESKISIFLNILVSLLFLFIINYLCKEIIELKRGIRNNSYEKNKNIIDSNMNNLI